MKKLIILTCLFLSSMSFSQVGIGTNSPDSSAMLDLTSTTQGFLPPRMTAAQRIAIASPVAGLEIWCTDCGTYGETQIYNGSSWTNLTGGTIAAVITPGTATSLGATSPIGIGTNAPNAAAALDLYSTSKGFLTPRMTFTQRNVIVSPVAGLQIYCLDCGSNGELQVFNGISWTNMIGGVTAVTNPYPPTVVVAIPGTTQALISFTPPTITGGATITGYTVTASADGITAIGSSSPIRVTGLTEATAYTFSVVATNGASLSSVASTSSSSITTISSTNTYAYCNGSRITDIVELTSSTGKKWMDRNLGANRAATSINDNSAYGCLYQWGRGNDGHSNMNYTTATKGINLASAWPNNIRSITETPNNTLIYSEEPTYTDWLVTPNPNLWQGVNGVNNPCPSGFRLPTITEYQAEITAYSITNSNTNSAFSYGPNGGFKFVKGGFRYYGDASGASSVGSYGFYWTSTVNSSDGKTIRFRMSESFINTAQITSRNVGHSVRCIKN